MSVEEYTIVPNVKIKKDGIVDFNELYRSTKKFLEDYGWANEEELEKKYVERTKPGGVKQIEVAWEGGKNVGGFFKYVLKLTFLIIGMTEVEVQQGNVKKKLQKGSFEVRIDARVETNKKWDKISGLQKIYLNMVVPKRLEEYKIDLDSKVSKLHSFIKTFMGIRD